VVGGDLRREMNTAPWRRCSGHTHCDDLRLFEVIGTVVLDAAAALDTSLISFERPKDDHLWHYGKAVQQHRRRWQLNASDR
jgi:hypothetical protein